MILAPGSPWIPNPSSASVSFNLSYLFPWNPAQEFKDKPIEKVRFVTFLAIYVTFERDSPCWA